jgi:hypothetical protein
MSETARNLAPNAYVLYREFNTTMVEEAESWRNFIFDPLPYLVASGAVADEGRDWRVVTMIINHHRPLNPRIGMARALVDPDADQIAIDIYKLQ